MTEPIDDLVENGPWPVRALCTECGSEHTSTALTRKSFERLEARLSPHGTCPSCIVEDESAMGHLTTTRAEEDPLPTMDEVRDTYREDSRDVDDPFDGRRDLF